jgi:hypothetical protein
MKPLPIGANRAEQPGQNARSTRRSETLGPSAGRLAVPKFKVGPEHRSSDCSDGRHHECGHRLGKVVTSGRNWMPLESHFVSVTATSAVSLPQTKSFLRPSGMSDVTVLGAVESKRLHRQWAEELAAEKRRAKGEG